MPLELCHQNSVIRTLLLELCHQNSVIRTLSLELCHQNYVVRTMSLELCYQNQVIRTMPLEMRELCEKCQKSLAWQDDACICSYECTFCPKCSAEMRHVCPNCNGQLVQRPKREQRGSYRGSYKGSCKGSHKGSHIGQIAPAWLINRKDQPCASGVQPNPR